MSRLIVHGVAGWAACALTMVALLALGNLGFALVVYAVAAPLFFVAVSRHHFGQPGAREPRPTAFAFVAITALLDLVVVAGAIQHSEGSGLTSRQVAQPLGALVRGKKAWE